MRRGPRDSPWRRFPGALALSLAVHVATLPTLQWVIIRPVELKERAEPAPAPTSVRVWSDEEINARTPPTPAAKVEVQPPPPEPEKEPEKKPEVKPDRQVVEIPPPPREEAPDDYRFLADYDSKVEKETVAARKEAPSPRMRKSDQKLISPGDDADGSLSAEQKVKSPEKRKQREDTAQPGDAARAALEPRVDDGGLRPNPKITAPTAAPTPLGDGPRRFTEQQRPERSQPAMGGGVVGSAPVPSVQSLLPTLGPEDLAQQDGSIDHVTDVTSADVTALNTREYKYAFFFNRVKRSVQQRWRVVDAHRRYDPYGRVFGVRDRLTVVAVTLTPTGEVEDLYVKKDSGVAFLDDVALQAFRDAAPFENPPTGLRDPDGRIRFQFGFYLEINGRGFRMFRYQ